jgi:carboxylesterase
MEGHTADGPPPVLYLLHGMSDDDTIWLRRTSIERYAAPLGLAVVMPQVHRSFYTDQAYGGRYWTFLTEELPELVGSLFRVSDRREDTFVAGLSMGGALALRLAAKHGDAISGVVVVNPGNKVHGLAAHALPVVRYLVRTTKGLANDVAKPGVDEIGYDRVPLHAAHSLRQFFRLVDTELPQVTQPLLLLRSPQDHVVSPADSARILSRVSSTDVTETVLERSYHVATLDYDAERIFHDSYDFIGRLAPGSAGPGAGEESKETASGG